MRFFIITTHLILLYRRCTVFRFISYFRDNVGEIGSVGWEIFASTGAREMLNFRSYGHPFVCPVQTRALHLHLSKKSVSCHL